MEHVKAVIVGGGVIGLAIAAQLSEKLESVLLVEKNQRFGEETSSRNSEILHAGIYYPKDSLKARLCVEGIKNIYKFCDKYEVPYSQVGKLIVATSDQDINSLESLLKRGQENGAPNLSMIDQDQIKKLEPYVTGLQAIHSPQSGIIDSHRFMYTLARLAEDRGATFAYNTQLTEIEKNPEGYLLQFNKGEFQLKTEVLINSAGLYSDAVAKIAGLDIDQQEYRLRYTKGSYFYYSKRSPVKRLIYPVPEKKLKGLGVHSTVDLSGRLKFGPDAEFVEALDYSVDPAKGKSFYEGVSKMISGLDPKAFVPDFAGIRPKIKADGIKDFVIQHESHQGLPGLWNLIGIESPGLTCSLSMANWVTRQIQEFLE